MAELTNDDGRTTVHLVGGAGSFTLGAEGGGGNLKVLSEEGGLMFQVTASFATLRGALMVGAKNHKGEIAIMDETGRPAIHADGNRAALQLGNVGNAGDLTLLDNNAKPILEVNGLTATLGLGGENKKGHIVVRDEVGAEVGRISGASLFLGREGKGGEILMLNNDGQDSFSVDGANGMVSVGTGDNRVLIDGSIGDLKLTGADCAERFALAEATDVEPGTVLVIAGESQLEPCSAPYDTGVAGVVFFIGAPGRIRTADHLVRSLGQI